MGNVDKEEWWQPEVIAAYIYRPQGRNPESVLSLSESITYLDQLMFRRTWDHVMCSGAVPTVSAIRSNSNMKLSTCKVLVYCIYCIL